MALFFSNICRPIDGIILFGKFLIVSPLKTSPLAIPAWVCLSSRAGREWRRFEPPPTGRTMVTVNSVLRVILGEFSVPPAKIILKQIVNVTPRVFLQHSWPYVTGIFAPVISFWKDAESLCFGRLSRGRSQEVVKFPELRQNPEPSFPNVVPR